MQKTTPTSAGARRLALVVSGERVFAEAVCAMLGLAGFEPRASVGLQQALDALRQEPRSLAVYDAGIDLSGGCAALDGLREAQPGLPVVMMSANPAVADVVALLRAGATDYLDRGALARLPECAGRIALKPAQPADDGVVAADQRSTVLLALARRVAASDATVLLEGESGSGKEILARFIHRSSERSGGPFVAVNCAAIPDTLLEAALFGFERGAYTGATHSQAGKFEQAGGGTILLDEVGDMPLALQAKLLRVLQEREVERLGGARARTIDVRVIAASNRSLADAVAAGDFREDLYYRLAVFPLAVPALRERRGDILPLALASIARHARAGRAVRLSAEACMRLQTHSWPGNVRELDNIIQRALVLAEGDAIELRHLLFDRQPDRVEVVTTLETHDIRSLEREHIMATLAAVNGSRKLAVQKLGISERTLRNKLRRYRQAANA